MTAFLHAARFEITAFYGLLFMAAGAVFVLGMAYRVYQFLRTPLPFPMPLTPAPAGRLGVLWRLVREAVLFRGLYGADKVLWVASMAFHFGLAALALRHFRVAFLSGPMGALAGACLVAGLGVLTLRRLSVEAVRLVTAPSHMAILLLLAGIGVSGLCLPDYLDIRMVMPFIKALPNPSRLPLPLEPLLLVHMFLVAVLLMVFPFSRLLHAPLSILSPSHAARDRHD